MRAATSLPRPPAHVRRAQLFVGALAIAAVALFVLALLTINWPTWARVQSGLTRNVAPLLNGL
ncbi:MAG TPA: hypothetical protein VLA56_21645, partial [Pseudomonadales bacterium]|nr:hypothetical protein [Pseudomonadales bacterium]